MMKKMGMGLLVGCLLVVLSACKGEDGLVSDPLDRNTVVEASKEDVLQAVEAYRQTLYAIKGEGGEAAVPGELLFLSDTDPLYSKDTLSPLVDHQVGLMNLEWIDMSILILDFTEVVLKTDYVLGEETRVFALTEDITWGWSLNEFTKVRITYEDDALHLVVLNSTHFLTASTFVFRYNEQGYIEILRIEEGYSQENPMLYVEDFVENIGISTGSPGSYGAIVYVDMDDGSRYAVHVSEYPEASQVSFQSAEYRFDGIDLIVYPWQEDMRVRYDLHKHPGFDQYTTSGRVFLEGQEVDYGEPINHLSNHQGSFLFIERTFTDQTDFSMETLGFQSDLNQQIIWDRFEAITMDDLHAAMRYPMYDKDLMYNLLGPYLYFDYTPNDDVVVTFQTQGVANMEVRIVERGSTISLDAPPEHPDYTFLGWSYMTDDPIIETSSIEVTGDTTLYAVYRINDPKTVRYFDENQNELYANTVAESVHRIMVDYQRPGYTLVGWALTPDGEPLYQMDDLVELTGDLDLYAIFEENN